MYLGRILPALVTLVALLLFTQPPQAAAGVHGVMQVVKGDVQVKSGKTGATKKARVGMKVFPKDTVITAKDSRAKIVMVDKNVLNISPGSQIVIAKYEFNGSDKKKNVLLNVIYGRVRSKVNQKYDGDGSKFQVKTPTAVAGVRGTDFFTSFSSKSRSTQIVTFEGKVKFGLPTAAGGIANAVDVGVGQIAKNIGGAPPSPPANLPKSALAKLEQASDTDRAPASSDVPDFDNSDSGDGDQQSEEGSTQESGDGKQESGDKKQRGPDSEAGAPEGDGKGNETSNDKKGPKGAGPGSAAGAAGPEGEAGEGDGGDRGSPKGKSASNGQQKGPPGPGGAKGPNNAGNGPKGPGGAKGPAGGLGASAPGGGGSLGGQDPAASGGTRSPASVGDFDGGPEPGNLGGPGPDAGGFAPAPGGGGMFIADDFGPAPTPEFMGPPSTDFVPGVPIGLPGQEYITPDQLIGDEVRDIIQNEGTSRLIITIQNGQ